MIPMCKRCGAEISPVVRMAFGDGLCFRCSLGRVWYMAAPSEDLTCARAWVRSLAETLEVIAVATWIPEVEVFDDSDPDQRANGLRRCLAVIHRCDALVLVGGKISAGMDHERQFAAAHHISTLDLTPFGKWPHDNPEQWISLATEFIQELDS